MPRTEETITTPTETTSRTEETITPHTEETQTHGSMEPLKRKEEIITMLMETTTMHTETIMPLTEIITMLMEIITMLMEIIMLRKEVQEEAMEAQETQVAHAMSSRSLCVRLVMRMWAHRVQQAVLFCGSPLRSSR